MEDRSHNIPEDLAKQQEAISRLTPEDLAKMQEEALKQAQEALSKLSPEERREAEIKAQKMMEEDMRSMQEMLDQAKAIAGESADKPVPKDKPVSKFCTNCGFPVSGGKFCSNCGQPLQKM
ncbi:MAG: hypothetical protein IKF90_11960 [Parasporobacterium sp.]|nr:hypothetical protein [Parasporobacterium sp.]